MGRRYYIPPCSGCFGNLWDDGHDGMINCERAPGHSGPHANQEHGIRWADPWVKARILCAWSACDDPAHVHDDSENGNGRIHVCPGGKAAAKWPEYGRGGGK